MTNLVSIFIRLPADLVRYLENRHPRKGKAFESSLERYRALLGAIKPELAEKFTAAEMRALAARFTRKRLADEDPLALAEELLEASPHYLTTAERIALLDALSVYQRNRWRDDPAPVWE